MTERISERLTAWLIPVLMIACAWVTIAGLGINPAHAGQRSTVLILGDSISAAYGIQREAGWVALLEERLNELDTSLDVVNASISGETTGGGLARLPQALATHAPAVVVVELGGNDGLRGYPIDQIRNNLSEIVQLSKAAGSRVLLVGMQIPPNYGPRYTSAFMGVYEEISASEGIPLVPSFLEEVALTPDMMQDDGIHPKAEAQGMLLDTLWPHLEGLLSY